MSDRYFVTSVRKSKGLYTDEGKYVDEAAAIVKLAELGEDPDCVIAEITEWLDSSSPQSGMSSRSPRDSTENGFALKVSCEPAPKAERLRVS